MANDEERRRGVQLQAALPEPSRFAAKWTRRGESSEGSELLGATVGAGVDLGLWGIVLAAPGAVVWLIRRRRASRKRAAARGT